MRRLDKEIKEEQIIKEILEESRVLRIGFAIENKPYIVPVNFAYLNNQLFIHSAREGQKIEMISTNSQVCFEMELHDEIIQAEKACNWTTKYRSLIGWGNIRISDMREEKIHGLNLIMRKYGWQESLEYSEGMLNNMVMIVIDIDHFTAKQSGSWE